MSDKTPHQALAIEALEAAKKIANDASDHHNVVDLNLTHDLAVAIPHFIDEALAALKAAPVQSQVLRPAVQWFAEQMEAALRRNDHKTGWAGCDQDYLLDGLDQEVKELDRACERFDPKTAKRIATNDEIIGEAADVANFAMMIADNAGPRIGNNRLSLPPSPSGRNTEVK